MALLRNYKHFKNARKKNVKPLMIKDENRGVGVRYSAGEFGFYYKQSRKPLIV